MANFFFFVVGRRVRTPVGHLRSASQEAGKQREDKEDHEQEEQYFGDSRRPGRDAGKAKDGGDNSDDEKDYCPVKHLHTFGFEPGLNRRVLLQFRMAV